MSLPSGPVANRGPYEITSVSTPLDFSTNPIRWIQIETAGSGGLVYTDEAGTSRTLTGLLAVDVARMVSNKNDPPTNTSTTTTVVQQTTEVLEPKL